MQVLFIGDVYGKPGRSLVGRHLPSIRKQFDFVIANGENAAGGFGLNRESFKTLTGAGVDAITMGNHTWDNKEMLALANEPQVIRPANYPVGAPGRGFATYSVGAAKITVVNLLGRIYMQPADCPFATLENILGDDTDTKKEMGAVIVDFHAEATSEKACLAWHFDGHIAALLGTHTHVPTADTRFLTQGTLFQTDVGMTGPRNSSIGMGLESAIYRFRTGLPMKNTVAEGPCELNAVAMTIQNNVVVKASRYRLIEGEAPASHDAAPQDATQQGEIVRDS